MARVKRAVNAHKKRRSTLEAASGYRGQRSRLYRKAKEQLLHSATYQYRDRKQRKGDFRQLWITRINAAARANDITYNRFIQGLRLAGVDRRPQGARRPRRQRRAGLRRAGRGRPRGRRRRGHRRRVGARRRPPDPEPGSAQLLQRPARGGPSAHPPQGPPRDRAFPCRGRAGGARGAARRGRPRAVRHRRGDRAPPRAGRGGADEISREDAAALSETVTPQGLVAVCRLEQPDARSTCSSGARACSPSLVEPNDPGNPGDDHPHRRRGRRRRGARRRRSGPLQRQGRPRQRRQPVPPAGGRRRCAADAARAPVAAGLTIARDDRARRDAISTTLDRRRHARRADPVAVRQRGARAARRPARPPPTTGCGSRSTAGPRASTSPRPRRSASTPARARNASRERCRYARAVVSTASEIVRAARGLVTCRAVRRRARRETTAVAMPSPELRPGRGRRAAARGASTPTSAAALAAFAAAGNLDELKAARLAHAGDRSPLALANREIGALPPAAKAAAGQRVGAARARSRRRRWPPVRPSSRPSATPRVLVEEAVDVTLPTDRRPRGRPAPAHHDPGADRRRLRRDGLRGRRRPRGRGRVVQLRRAEHRRRTTRRAS